MRAGKIVKQLKGDLEYKAFVPNFLPFSLKNDPELDELLSRANLALGRLDGVSEIVPDVDFLTLMFARKEATFSSQVEGTQATFADVLKVEADIEDKIPYDVQEIFNYIKAMNYGLERLKTLPLSSRMTKEIHKILLRGVRGQSKSPGEFKKSQNWVGGPTIKSASFVPCPPLEMNELMSNLEKLFHDNRPIPALVKIALIHSQFENIHPFLDGNGRIGRLLITFYLCQQKVLNKPLLYLSVYFKEHQKDYYYWLNAVHERDDLEGWIKFFLKGIIEVAEEAFSAAQRILELRNKDTLKISELGRTTKKGMVVLNHLYKNPFVTLRHLVDFTGLSKSNAYSLQKKLEKLGILHHRPSKNERAKIFVHVNYLKLFE